MDFLCNSILLTLGRDQEVYDFMKLQHSGYVLCHLNLEDNSTSYATFKNMVKNEGDNNCKENFVKENFFQHFLQKQTRVAWNSMAITEIYQIFWLPSICQQHNPWIHEKQEGVSSWKEFLCYSFRTSTKKSLFIWW